MKCAALISVVWMAGAFLSAEEGLSHLTKEEIASIYPKEGEAPDPRFKECSCSDLMPYITGEKRLEKGATSIRTDSITAFKCYMKRSYVEAEKTKDGVYQVRVALALTLFRFLRKHEHPHDSAHLVYMIRYCSGVDYLRTLLREAKSLDCCYGRALLTCVAEPCGVFGWTDDGGTIDDWPLLFSCFEKELPQAKGNVSNALARATGESLTKLDGSSAGQSEWVAWWNGRPFEGALPRKDLHSKLMQLETDRERIFFAQYYEKEIFWIRDGKERDQEFKKVWYAQVTTGPSGSFRIRHYLLDAITGEIVNDVMSVVDDSLREARKLRDSLQSR